MRVVKVRVVLKESVCLYKNEFNYNLYFMFVVVWWCYSLEWRILLVWFYFFLGGGEFFF